MCINHDEDVAKMRNEDEQMEQELESSLEALLSQDADHDGDEDEDTGLEDEDRPEYVSEPE